MTKLVLGVAVALVVALGAGWLWGASGRWDSERALQDVELRSGLIEGRSLLLDARIDLYNVNFGNASKHLEGARSALRPTVEGLKGLGREDQVKQLEVAMAKIAEAQQMAGQLDQSANTRTAEAAQIVAEVLDTGNR